MTDPSFRSTCEVAIHVPDLGRAERFYVGVLGFAVVDRSDDCLELDTGALRLYVKRDGAELRSFIPSLDVADYDRAKGELEAAGCSIVKDSPGSRGFYLADPFGLVIDVIERKA